MIIVGDSHVEALGPALEQRLGAAYVARRGLSSADYAKATDWLPALAGHLVVVYVLGTNDASKGLSVAAQDAAWRSLISNAYRAGARIVYVVGPPMFKDAALAAKASSVAAFQAATLPKLGATWIDGRPLSTAGPWSADGIHQTILAYNKMADRLAPLLVTPPAPVAVAQRSGDGIAGLVAGLFTTSGILLVAGLGLRASRR